MKLAFAAGLALSTLIGVAACAHQTIADSDIGLAKGSVFDVATPQAYTFDGSAPKGAAPPSGMPPMIPHTIDKYLPITTAVNDCVECHDKPEPSATRKTKPPTAMPASHYLQAAGQEAVVKGSRYNCTSCHAPQANVPELVRNRGG